MPSNDFVRPMGVPAVPANEPYFSGLPISYHVEPEPMSDEDCAAYDAHSAKPDLLHTSACPHTDREWRCPTCMTYCEEGEEGRCLRCDHPLGAPMLVCEDCGEESQDEGTTWEPTETRIRRTQQEND